MKIFAKVLKWFLITAAVIFVLVQFVASPILTHQVNKKLAGLPEYTGRVSLIEIALWRGTVAARDFELRERTPLDGGNGINVKNGSVSIAFGQLLKGEIAITGEISGVTVFMTKPSAPPGSSDKQATKPLSPAGRNWQRGLVNAFPFKISKFEIKDATVFFEDRSTQPVTKVIVDEIHLKAKGLGFRSTTDDELPGVVEMQAQIAGTGQLIVNAKADSFAPTPRFNVTMEIKGLQLLALHDFLAAYALIDVSAGSFELASEANAAGGHYDGYIKPFFKDIEFKAISDPNKNALQHTATKVASAVTTLLKNKKGQVATKAPFKGDFADNHVDVWTTIENLLRNAFVQSIREGLEGRGQIAN